MSINRFKGNQSLRIDFKKLIFIIECLATPGNAQFCCITRFIGDEQFQFCVSDSNFSFPRSLFQINCTLVTSNKQKSERKKNIMKLFG